MDQSFFFLINGGFHSPALDLWMACLSSWALWMPVVIIGTLLVLLFGGFKARSFVCCAVLVLAFTDAVLVNGLKHLVQRPRPFQTIAGVRMVTLHKARPQYLALVQPALVKYSTPTIGAKGNSFPSAHVANNFAVAVLLAWFYRRRGWLFFFVASAVAYSRIYVGDHYPFDVFAGVAAGVLASFGGVCLISWAWKWVGPTYLPSVFTKHLSITGNSELHLKNQQSQTL